MPRITFPENSKEAGGRPLTTEEYERVLEVCRRKRGDTAASWVFLLNGLWWSGLRISEALALTWGDKGLLTMDMEGRRPMFCIKAELSKNGKAQRFPMPPEFFEMIDAVPSVDRSGYVFNLSRNGNSGPGEKGRISLKQLSETVSDFGRDANVKVKDKRKGEPVFASAHDLHRSFGFRWAKRVMPPILEKMMRHSDINTTLRYYVTQGEEQTADAVWNAVPMRVLPAPAENVAKTAGK